MRIWRLALWVVPLLLAFDSPRARADVLYDTYPLGAATPNRYVGDFTATGKSFQYADPFTVAGGDFTLQSITVRLRTATTPYGDFTIRLRADAFGQPGIVLESWDLTDSFVLDTDVQLDSVAIPELHDGMVYWVNVGMVSGSGSGSWQAANSLSDAFLYAETQDVDPTWLQPPSAQLLGLTRVEAEPVPEPLPGTLGLAACLALVATTRSLRVGS
ncbi:MAG TPA: choice-of-anchor R domain-containing protein [Terriglobales bacterium]|nr:choice-of-anchor R domain-containing protein [Terriglobales bacterium]